MEFNEAGSRDGLHISTIKYRLSLDVKVGDIDNYRLQGFCLANGVHTVHCLVCKLCMFKFNMCTFCLMCPQNDKCRLSRRQ